MVYDHRQLDRFAKELCVLPGQNDPAQQLIDAAARDVAVVIDEIDPDQYLALDPEVKQVVAARHLIAQLGKRGHSEQVASWAVYKLIETGRLEAEIAEIQLPRTEGRHLASNDVVIGESIDGDVLNSHLMIDEVVTPYLIPSSSAPGRAVEARLPDGQPSSNACDVFQYLVVWPTDELWEWYRSSSTTAPSLTCEAAEKDGPVESLFDSHDEGHFRWKGKESRFSGISWRLLHCLGDRKRVSYADIGEQVWGRVKPNATIRSAVTRLNAAMSNNGIPLAWHCRNKHVLPCE